MVQAVMISSILSLVFTLTVASGLAITCNSGNRIIGEVNKNVTIRWKINHTESIHDIRVYKFILTKKIQILIWDDPKPVVSRNGRHYFGDHRLVADFIDNMFTLQILNVQYNDRGTYSIHVWLKSFEKKNADITLLVRGPPELCMGNSSDDSQLKYTVCGVPLPTVKWGFIGNSLKNTLRAATRNDTFYAHDYVLYLTPNLCEKMVHFEANGYNGNTYSWEEKIKKRCDDPLSSTSSTPLTVGLVVIVVVVLLVVACVAEVYRKKNLCLKKTFRNRRTTKWTETDEVEDKTLGSTRK